MHSNLCHLPLEYSQILYNEMDWKDFQWTDEMLQSFHAQCYQDYE